MLFRRNKKEESPEEKIPAEETEEAADEESTETEKENRIRFFGDLDVLQKLLSKGLDTSDFVETELWFELIDIPYTIRYKADAAHCKVDFFDRTEMGVLDEEKSAANLDYNRSNGEAGGSANAELKDNMAAFFAAAVNLAKYAKDNGLLTPVDEHSGILLKAGSFKVKSESVTGKKRPNLMCKALFGAPHMSRPYMDEFLERSIDEMMGVNDANQEADEEYRRYLNGDDENEPDFEAAVEVLRTMAENGSAIGMFNLGLHYWKGCGVERDLDQAIAWMEKAAEEGDEDAPHIIKELQSGKAARKIADTGDAQGQADYASFLMKTAKALQEYGPGKDYEECVSYAMKAAAQKNPDGMYVLALAYEHGRGVEEDLTKAFRLYERAANMGHAPSMSNLACCYGKGEGVEKDEEKAMEWVRKAADLKDPTALRILGIEPDDDEDEDEDDDSDILDDVDIDELLEGVEAGDADAIKQYAVAGLLGSDKLDIPQDEAVSMLEKLADQGDSESLRILGTHFSQLVSDEDGMHPEMNLRAIRYFARLGDELFEDADLAADYAQCFSWMPDEKNSMDLQLARFWYKVSADLGKDNSLGLYNLITFTGENMAQYGYTSEAEFMMYAAENNLLDDLDELELPDCDTSPEEYDRLYAAFCEKYPI